MAYRGFVPITAAAAAPAFIPDSLAPQILNF